MMHQSIRVVPVVHQHSGGYTCTVRIKHTHQSHRTNARDIWHYAYDDAPTTHIPARRGDYALGLYRRHHRLYVMADDVAPLDAVLAFLQVCIASAVRSPLDKWHLAKETMSTEDLNVLPLLLLYKDTHGWKKGSIIHKQHMEYASSVIDFEQGRLEMVPDGMVHHWIETKRIYDMSSDKEGRDLLLELLFDKPVTWISKAWITRYCPNGERHYYNRLTDDIIMTDFIRPEKTDSIEGWFDEPMPTVADRPRIGGDINRYTADRATPSDASTAVSTTRVVHDAVASDDIIIELKMDGRRCIMLIYKHAIVLITRGGHRHTVSRSVLKDRRMGHHIDIASSEIGELHYILDGELIAANYAERRPAAESVLVGAGTQGFYIAFDLLYAPIIKEKAKRVKQPGYDRLYTRPLAERRRALEKVVAQYASTGIVYKDAVALPSKQFIWLVQQIAPADIPRTMKAEEGIVIKAADMPYWTIFGRQDDADETESVASSLTGIVSGGADDDDAERRHWYKYKERNQTVDVIMLGGRWSEAHPDEPGALEMYLLGDNDEYVTIGSVAALSHADVKLIRSIGITTNPTDTTKFGLVAPLYASVLFDLQDGVIRHPRIVEWRDETDDVRVTRHSDVFV